MTPRCPKQLPRDEYTQLLGGEYTGESRLFGNEYTGESRLPGSEYTGESITNSNYSSNIRKNLKSFLGVSNGTRKKCLMKKTRVKKSRDTVPLSRFSFQKVMKNLLFHLKSVKTGTHKAQVGAGAGSGAGAGAETF
jgi:hypothetical protein